MFKNYRELINSVANQLENYNEAIWFFEDLLEVDKFKLYLLMDDPVNPKVLNQINEKVQLRQSGIPTQYLTRHWQFRNILVKVDPRCLIPRPESELLIDIANNFIRNTKKTSVNILDLGTGSLCLCLALAQENKAIKEIYITAAEKSLPAIEIANENLNLYPDFKNTIKILESNWFGSLDVGMKNKFDLIISNPPYLAHGADVDASVKNFEPHIALFSEDGGFADTKEIIVNSKSWLSTDSMLILETDPSLVFKASNLLKQYQFENVSILTDQFGLNRFITAHN
jgi:release factor glutamine methyltransferase